MADKRKTITISVNDDFSRQLKQFASLIDQSQDELDDFQSSAGSGKGARQMITNVRDMTLAFNGLVTMVGSVVQGVDEFAQLGTQTRRNKAAFEALSGSTKAYEENLKAVQSALKGTVTDSEAAAIGSNLLNLGLAESAAEIENFTEIAATIGAMSPQINSTEEAISQIGLTIANMSFARLDALGLAVGDVRNRMKELQAETKGMTKEQAFNEAVMEGLAAKAAVLGDEFSEIGASQDRMRARFRGFKEDIAEEVSGALDTALTSGEQLLFILGELGAKDTVIAIVTELNGEEFDFTTPESILTPGFNEFTAAEAVARFSFQQGGDVAAPFSSQATGMSIRPETQGLMSIAPNATEVNFLPMSMQLDPGVSEAVQADLAAAISANIDTTLPQFDIASTLTGALPPGVAFGGGLREQTPEMEQAAEALGFIELAFGKVKDKADEATGAVSAFAAGAEKFSSLAEKFGLGAEQFDVDVANAMKGALQELEVDAELAAEAMEKYDLIIGQSSGSSIVFEGQMNVLAEALGAGTIGVDEYVSEVERLAGLDFSKIDAVTQSLIDAGDVTGAKGFAETVGGEGGLEQFDESFAALGGLLTDIGLLGGGEGGPGAETGGQSLSEQMGIEEFAINVEKATSESRAAVSEFVGLSLQEGETLSEGYKIVMSDVAKEAALAAVKTEKSFKGASEAVLSDIAKVDVSLTEMLTRQRKVQFTLTTTSAVSEFATEGAGPLPEFQEGGFTGTGTQPFPAMLHPNEVVVPLNKLPMGGGQNSSESIVVEVNLDGRQVESSVQDVKRLKNER